MINTRLFTGKEYWRPAHARQDYWASMYYLMDAIQQLKPAGYRRFVSNEPHTAIDLAMSILTRNESFWRIALFESMSENADERRLIGKVERTLQGIIYDIDEMFSQRLKMRFWKQAASQALIRGWIWGKVHITNDALKYRPTPIIAEMYDPRLVYPHTDAFGLAYVLIESQTTVGDLASMYPDKWGYKAQERNFDPNRAAMKIEYWSNDRGERKGICAVMAMEQPLGADALSYGGMGNTVGATGAEFVIPPYYHGYTPEALPVVGVPVNGINLTVKPQLGELMTERMAERRNLLGTASAYDWWNGPNAHVAELGRSLLVSVEEHVP